MANHNIAAVNRRFRKSLDKSWDTLNDYNRCGFFDGGCLLFAEALVQWSDGDMKLGAIGRTRLSGQCDHYFVSMDVAGKTFLLDANGLKLKTPYRRYWEKEELWEPASFIENPQHDPESGIPKDAAFSKILCDELIAELGTYSQWKADVELVFEPEDSLSPC